MLTYDDCLGLSELTPSEIAAIAKHEHVPEIVALEMGWCLCASPEGKQVIRRMILDGIGQANERGDGRAAAELELVLRHFTGAQLDQYAPAELDRPVPDAQEAMTASPTEPSRGDCDHMIHGLGLDSTAAPWVRERVDTYLTAMLRHYGLDRASLQTCFRSEMHMAEMRCATCTEIGRCRRFLAGAAASDAPAGFCPNAQLFGELQQQRMG
jgi:hypothetical protein